MADTGEQEEGPAPQEDALFRILDVPIRLTVELGRRQLSIADVLQLAPGSLVEFPKPADEPLEILVNDRPVAKGEAVVLGDRYGVRIIEVLNPGEKIPGLGKAGAS